MRSANVADSDRRTDQDLVEAANGGDAAAFGILYQRYRNWIVSLAWRFGGHRDDALDVLQETFTYLLGKFPGFELTASMKTFLYPAVKNLSITAAKKRRRVILDDEILDQFPAASADEVATREELAEVMQSLSASHREVVLMRFVDSMTLDEIASALDVPVGTVKSRLHHALAALRQDKRTRDYFDR